MSGRPRGTVTFLFTDIEGSTRLLQRLGDRYGDVLADHHRLLRGAIAAHGGSEVRTDGDAFFVAFGHASAAVAAAVDAQRALAGHAWPEDGEVRVRMGLHTGEAELRGDDYVGLDVHRAARIAAAAHGGQVLISSSTQALVDGDLPAGVALRDLGEYSLKDLARPERLVQLVVDGLPARFPVPPSASRLPPSPNSTIGRDDEIAAVAERVSDDRTRLLTLTGPGGVGKTRLALEAARAAAAGFADGAFWVALAEARRPENVASTIVGELTIVVLSGESPAEAAERFLSAKHSLLVLDNLEQVVDAAPAVAHLLEACPRLTVLATSREPLGLLAEERHPVAPLDAETAAVALFRARARAHDPRFELDEANAGAVAQICRHLDGLPLAVELAAARCALLSPPEIAARLRGALSAIGPAARDVPARQRTVRATIDWSHELLTEEEQRAFARCAIFAGGAAVADAEAITGSDLDTLLGLVTKSLLTRTGATPTRLGMLQTIHAYAGERFAASPDADAIAERHCRHYLNVVRRHGTEQALWSADGPAHLAVLDAESDNLHAALDWAVGRRDAERALALTAALGRYWIMRNRYAEALTWIERVLGLPGADADPVLRLEVLATKARALWPVGRGAEDSEPIREVEGTARRLGDPLLLARALTLRADHEITAERLAAAEDAADEALRWAVAAGDDWEIAEASRAKPVTAAGMTELRERVDRAETLLIGVGNVYRRADMLTSAAYASLCLGSAHDAADLAARAAPLARALASPFVQMINSGNLGLAALLIGAIDTAEEAFREELVLCREMVVRPVAHEGLHGMAALAVVAGDDARAATLVGAADAHRYDQPPDALGAELDERYFAPARDRHGSEAWRSAAARGARLSFEDAIAYALGEDARTATPARWPAGRGGSW